MTAFFAGIDGGQSSTVAVIGNGTGRIVARGRAGPADEVGAGRDSTRLHDALRDALADARKHVGLPDDTHFDAIVAGVSGYEGRVYGQAPELPATRFVLMHDAPIAHAGALGGEAGVVAIAGTGSVVYGTDGKRGRTYGGWGYLFGDEGSAFWLVREGLALMMRCEEDRSADVAREARIACEFFGQPTLRHVARAFYAGELTRHRLASFAVEAMHFERFREIAEHGADRLAGLVRAAIAQGAHPTVSCVGGMFSDPRFYERACAGIRGAGRGTHIVEARHDAATGALLLAYREAGLAIPVVSVT